MCGGEAEPVQRLAHGAAVQLCAVDQDGERVELPAPGSEIAREIAREAMTQLIADGLLYVLNDSGLLTLVEAVPDAYKPLSQAQVLTGHDAWGPLALAGGRLIARDLTRMVCLDVSQVAQEKE